MALTVIFAHQMYLESRFPIAFVGQIFFGPLTLSSKSEQVSTKEAAFHVLLLPKPSFEHPVITYTFCLTNIPSLMTLSNR
jgi:hypothetical protein